MGGVETMAQSALSWRWDIMLQCCGRELCGSNACLSLPAYAGPAHVQAAVETLRGDLTLKLGVQEFEDGHPVKSNPLAWWTFKDCFDYLDRWAAGLSLIN